MKNSDDVCRQNYFSNKKTIVHFVLSLFVFFIHFRVFSTIKAMDGYLSMALDILNTLTHVAVPLFFLISGALFYRNYTPSMTLKKWKSRFVSLCIPYMVWNTIWLTLALLGYYTPLGSLLGGVKTALTFEAVFSGIFLHQFFEPFWFILQLIVLVALCPIIYLLLKNKIVGIMIIGVCFLLSFFGLGRGGILVNSPNMVIIYLIGAWIGMHHFEWITFRVEKKQAIIALLVYILCCAFQVGKQFLPQWFPVTQISLVVTTVSCVAFYIFFDLFSMKTCPNFMKDSFLIYAMHSFVGAALSKIVSMLLPSGNIFSLLITIITYVATVVIICLVGNLLGKYTPRLKRILVGR